ncbi:MAG: calcium-binding protein [Cyanothece sp. SIO2G6]|nr:calcium-binding protein [Cyanothece sp. SIO2G6]
MDSISGGSGDDRIEGDDGNDLVHGQRGSNVLLEGDGADWVYGNSGDDMLQGDRGNDDLFGSSGDDMLAGFDLITASPDLGEVDHLTGGKGSDRFVLDTTGNRHYGYNELTPMTGLMPLHSHPLLISLMNSPLCSAAGQYP